jgi:hypothetical protein
VIRFGVVATVVSAAVALLIAGALSGDLALVYISIGLAALALVMLVIGVAVWRDQVFSGSTSADGRQAAADQQARAHASPVSAAPAQASLSAVGRSAPAEDSWTRSSAAPGRQARPAREGAVPQTNGLDEGDHPPGRERHDRERAGRQPASGGQPPTAAGRPGRQREPVAADWAAPQPSPAGWAGQAAGAADRPGRNVSRPAGQAPRRPESAESHQAGRAGAAEPPDRRPPGAEPYPSVEQPEPADDPTRLAHKLGIGMAPSPDNGTPAPSARPAEAAARAMPRDLAPESATEQRSPADPLASPPAASSAGRTGKPGPGAAEPEPAPAASGSAGASGRPQAAAESAATGSAPAGTPAESPAPSHGATTTAGSSAATADRETSRAGGEPAGSDASTVAAEGTASAPAAEAATPQAATPQAGAADGATGQVVPDDAPADTQVMVVPGIARYHQADCILIRFLGEDDLQRMSREDAEAAGCAACRACRP